MGLLIHEPQITDPGSDVANRREGIAFVPCAVCLKPVDLAVVAERGHGQLCDAHRVTGLD
jgi:hypothetical protein